MNVTSSIDRVGPPSIEVGPAARQRGRLSPSGPRVLALDLGGTRMRAALVNARGDLDALARLDTPTSGADQVLTALVGLARGCLSAAPFVTACGLAAPGPLDPRTGVVHSMPNLPGFEDFPLAERVANALGLAVVTENDANLAALGEYHFGAGSGHDPLIYLTVSTGVGGGIIAGSRIFGGAHGLAGELGHIVVRDGGPACALGHSGCLEATASGTAVALRAREAIAAGQATVLAALVQPTAEDVAAAARAGDELAGRLFHAAGTDLGLAIGGLVNAFDPARVVVGGGMSQAWDLLAAPVLAGAARVIMAPRARRVDIVPATTGDAAGLLGAGVLALEHLA